MEDDSVDFICSNNTFEHIPETVLPGILREFKRVLKPFGAMSHFIDMSDHFAHSDPGISIYHFLKFSKKRWDLIDNRLQPQNRLRFRDYLDMYQEAGIPVTPEITGKGDPAQVAGMKIDGEFSGYSAEELAISHAYVITP